MEVTWIVLRINSQTHVHPPPWEEEIEGMKRGMIKMFEVGEML